MNKLILTITQLIFKQIKTFKAQKKLEISKIILRMNKPLDFHRLTNPQVKLLSLCKQIIFLYSQFKIRLEKQSLRSQLVSSRKEGKMFKSKPSQHLQHLRAIFRIPNSIKEYSLQSQKECKPIIQMNLNMNLLDFRSCISP